jgi:hypothetical protein
MHTRSRLRTSQAHRNEYSKEREKNMIACKSECYRNGDIKLLATMRASILACDEPFTVEELAQSIYRAHSGDYQLQRMGFDAWKQMVERHVHGSFSHPLLSESDAYICDRLANGRYLRAR